MRIVTHLDKEDIRRIIAKTFDVKVEDVMIDCYMDWVGYGMDEHQEPAVRAVVDKAVIDC